MSSQIVERVSQEKTDFSNPVIRWIDYRLLLARHRENANVQGFVKGAYAAAIGTILGACFLLGKIAIGDWLTAGIGIVSLAVLFRWKVSNPQLIAATAVVGLIAYPWLQQAWVMVK